MACQTAEKENIRSKREKTKETLINGLLCNTSVSATARATGISETTIYRYLNDPAFVDAYEERRREMMRDSCHALQANMGGAIEELVKIIKAPETSPQIRLNAIDMLLRHSYRMTEQMDILSRLEQLEAMNER